MALRGGVGRLRVPGRLRRAFIALGAAPSLSVFGAGGRAGRARQNGGEVGPAEEEEGGLVRLFGWAGPARRRRGRGAGRRMEDKKEEGEAEIQEHGPEHWFSKWERQCLAEAEQEEALAPELQDEAAAQPEHKQQKLWHLFQNSATAVAQLYKGERHGGGRGRGGGGRGDGEDGGARPGGGGAGPRPHKGDVVARRPGQGEERASGPGAPRPSMEADGKTKWREGGRGTSPFAAAGGGLGPGWRCGALPGAPAEPPPRGGRAAG